MAAIVARATIRYSGAAQMSNDVVPRFDALSTAIIYLTGLRALTGCAKPGNMRSLQCDLIENGWAGVLSVDTQRGRTCCICDFASPVTDADLRSGDWLLRADADNTDDVAAFIEMPIQGNA